jgi:drug/metabolite transporter (DMT)-like permease
MQPPHPHPATDTPRDNLRGAAFMVAAMAGFAVEDMLLKSAGHSLPVGQILILFGLPGMAAFALLALARGEPVLTPAILSRPILIRALFEVTGRLFYTLAIVFTALSSASAILQATPLIVVAGAALLFGERVGWRRWLAVAVGFAGVLVILRPGIAGFTALSLLAVLGTLGFAGRDLATRAAPPALSPRQLGVYGFAMLIPAGTILMAITGGWRWPTAPESALIAGAVVVGVGAYYALTIAMRTGAVGAVTPFRYTRLVFAMILGVAIFGERPDTLTIVGSVVVVAAGLYALTARRS